MKNDNKQNKALSQTCVSGSVFHPSISHINCDKNISKETINAINKMAELVLKTQQNNNKN